MRNLLNFGGGQKKANPLIWIVIIGAILIYSQQEGSLFGELDTGHVPRLTVPPEEIGGAFALTDHMGKPVTDEDFRGSHMLIYFGYSWCPDVCPTTLTVISQVLDDLGSRAAGVQPLFITVDPERDTVEHLARYVPNFHARLRGLTGPPEAIDAALASYGVHRNSRRKDADDDAYLVDHTSVIYLMGPDGAFLASFRPDEGPTRLEIELERLIHG